MTPGSQLSAPRAAIRYRQVHAEASSVSSVQYTALAGRRASCSGGQQQGRKKGDGDGFRAWFLCTVRVIMHRHFCIQPPSAALFSVSSQQPRHGSPTSGLRPPRGQEQSQAPSLPYPQSRAVIVYSTLLIALCEEAYNVSFSTSQVVMNTASECQWVL